MQKETKLSRGWIRCFSDFKGIITRTSHFILEDGLSVCDRFRQERLKEYQHPTSSKLEEKEPIDWKGDPNYTELELSPEAIQEINTSAYIPCKLCRFAAEHNWTIEQATEFVSKYNYDNVIKNRAADEALEKLIKGSSHGNNQ